MRVYLILLKTINVETGKLCDKEDLTSMINEVNEVNEVNLPEENNLIQDTPSTNDVDLNLGCI